MGTIELIAVMVAAAVIGCSIAFALALERRYAARLAAANERERALQMSLELERIARAEEAAIHAERLTAAEERERALAERLEPQDTGDAPVALAHIAERAASLVLAQLPIDAVERERMAACAALGGLMTAHNYIGLALDVMLKRADLNGPIYHLRYDDDADDVDADDIDTDPGKLQ
jgi:hypothetical protein